MIGEAQRFSVLLDGAICSVGLGWCEALVEASRLRHLLAEDPSDEPTIVTVSEQALDEPRVSWRRGGDACWERFSEPVWRAEAS